MVTKTHARLEWIKKDQRDNPCVGRAWAFAPRVKEKFNILQFSPSSCRSRACAQTSTRVTVSRDRTVRFHACVVAPHFLRASKINARLSLEMYYQGALDALRVKRP